MSKPTLFMPTSARPSTVPFAVLPLAALMALAACGGSTTASVPPKLDVPASGQTSAVTSTQAASPASAAPAAAGEAAPLAPAPLPASVQAIINAPDRTEDDRKIDGGRHPGELLAFLDLKPGMRVAELGAGGGYTTELVARAVGSTGKVWAQNNAFIMKFAAKPLSDRLARPVMANVVRVEREFDAPLPPDATNLDAVVSVLFYHDTVWLGADRAKMNKAVFDALKHGGEYVIVDHSAASGHGLADVKTLHRIDEATLVQEVEHAGFTRAATADFLRNPKDTRDWSDSPREAGDRRGTSDRFVVKFTKP